MSKMNFAIALKMTTDQFKRGADVVKKGLLSIQYQIIGMASALGLGSIGLSNMVSRFVQVARETTRARVALKNISVDTANYSKNIQFLSKLSNKYGQEINGMTSEFAKFSAAATSAGVSLSDQHEIFSSFSRSIAAFGMNTEDAKLSYMALSQMMSKGNISSEELRQQLGERMPIAMEAMARATGNTIQELDGLLKKGAILSKDVMLPFVKEMEKMTPNVDVDNIETSLGRLTNTLVQLTDKLKVADLYKKIIDGASSMLSFLQQSFERVITTIAATLVGGKLIGAFRKLTEETKIQNEDILANKIKTEQQSQIATAKRIAAEKRLNEMGSMYYKVSKEDELKYYEKYTAAQKALDKARVTEKAALLAKETAAEKAAAAQSQTAWTVAWTKIGNFLKGVLTTIKGLFASLIPMALIGLTTNFVMKLVEARKESEKISRLFTDYQDEIKKSTSDNAEIKKLQTLQSLLSDTNTTETERKSIQNEIFGILGSEANRQEDINSLIQQRIELLKESARAEMLTSKYAESDYSYNSLQGKYTKDPLEFKRMQIDYQRSRNSKLGRFAAATAVQNKYGLARKSGMAKDGFEFAADMETAIQLNSVINDIKDKLPSAVKGSLGSSLGSTFGNTYNSTSTGSSTAAELTDLQKVEKQYKEELIKINNLHAAGVTAEDDKNKAIDELNNVIYREIGTIEGANAGLNDTFLKAKQGVENPLFKEASKTVALPTEQLRDTTFDYKKDSLQQLEELRDIKAEYINTLKGISEEEFSGITDIIDNEAAKLKNIDELIKAGTLKKDISELSKEINNNLFNGLQDVYGVAKNLGNAFLNIKDIFADADATFFEKIISVFDALFSTINGIMGIMQTIEDISALTENLNKAKQVSSTIEIASIGAITSAKVAADTAEATSAMTKSATVVAALSAEEVAAKGVMAAKSAAAYASIPFAGVGLAAGQIATMQALITGAKALSALPGFAEGGIVPGSSFTGDKIMGRLNSGEMILNRAQQANLWKTAQGKITSTSQQGSPQTLIFDIEGKSLVAVLDQQAQRIKRV